MEEEKKLTEEVAGCLGDGAKETDFILEEGDLAGLPTLFEKDDIIFEYNQGTSLDCTIYGAVGAVSDLTNYEYSKERIAKLVEESFKRGRVKGQGWFVEAACHLIRDDWNNDKELVEKYGKIAYYRISKSNDEVIEGVLGKKYTIVGNRSTDSEFTKDYRTDAVLDGAKFGTITNGHCIDVISNKGVRSEKNSYKGRKTYDGKKDCNIFELKHKLVEISNYGPNFYVFTLVKEDNYEEVKRLETLKTKLNSIITLNSEIWHLVNDESYRKALNVANNANRAKLKTVEELLAQLR